MSDNIAEKILTVAVNDGLEFNHPMIKAANDFLIAKDFIMKKGGEMPAIEYFAIYTKATDEYKNYVSIHS